MEWQLPVRDSVVDGKGYQIAWNAKIHCFDENGISLCKKYFLVGNNFDTTDYGEKDITTHPEYFCKECVRRFQKIKE